MIRLIASLLILIALSSCANLNYSPEKNCSPRGLKQLNETAENVSNPEMNKNYDAIRKFLIKNSPDLQKCYQEYLNDQAVNHREFAVCTVSTVSEGKLVFLDIADQVNSLNKNLHQCLVEKFNSYDWKSLNLKTPMTINQPLRFRLKN